MLPCYRNGHVCHPAFQQGNHPIGVGRILRQLHEPRAPQLQQDGVRHADGQYSEPLGDTAQVHPEKGLAGLDPAEVAAWPHGLAYVGLRREHVHLAGAHHQDRIRVVEQDRSVRTDLDRSSLLGAKPEQPLLLLGRRLVGSHQADSSLWVSCSRAPIRRE